MSEYGMSNFIVDYVRKNDIPRKNLIEMLQLITEKLSDSLNSEHIRQTEQEETISTPIKTTYKQVYVFYK